MRSVRRCWLITKVDNSVAVLSYAYVMCEHLQEVDNGEIPKFLTVQNHMHAYMFIL